MKFINKRESSPLKIVAWHDDVPMLALVQREDGTVYNTWMGNILIDGVEDAVSFGRLFSMYQNRELTGEPFSPIVVNTLEKTCNACPAQWEGETVDGLRVYIRYRHGRLSVEVGNDLIFLGTVGGPFAGSMTERELKDIIRGILILPEGENSS